MADFVVLSTNPGTSGNGTAQSARLDPRRELVVVPSLLQLAVDGKLFIANRGTASTPVSFAKTAYDEDQPQLVVRVPENITIIPIYLEVVFESSAGTNNDVIWSFTTNDIGNGTSTAVTPANARVGGPGSSCTVRRDYTGNATAATGLTEFARFFYDFADATTDPLKLFQVDGYRRPVVLVGDASLQLHVVAESSTAPSGYVTVVWAEFSSSEKGL